MYFKKALLFSLVTCGLFAIAQEAPPYRSGEHTFELPTDATVISVTVDEKLGKVLTLVPNQQQMPCTPSSDHCMQSSSVVARRIPDQFTVRVIFRSESWDPSQHGCQDSDGMNTDCRKTWNRQYAVTHTFTLPPETATKIQAKQLHQSQLLVNFQSRLGNGRPYIVDGKAILVDMPGAKCRPSTQNDGYTTYPGCKWIYPDRHVVQPEARLVRYFLKD